MKFSKKIYEKMFFIIFTLAIVSPAWAKLKVVTTSSDLASIAREIAGDKAEVKSLTPGNTDLHFVSARPNFIKEVNEADILVLIGMDLEVGWVPAVIDGARNKKVRRGSSGYCDASVFVKPLEVPSGEINRSMGDIHALGNPHYWVDPYMGVMSALKIRNCLKSVDVNNANYYDQRFNDFKNKVIRLTKELKMKMSPHENKKIVVYHKEFAYLANRFNLQIAEAIEAKPGVSPSTSRIEYMVNFVKNNNVDLVVTSSFSTNLQAAKEVASQAGVKFIVLPIQTKSGKGTDTYLQMIETVVSTLAENL